MNVPGDPDRTTVTGSGSKKKATIASRCACLHPCDLEEFYGLIDTTCTAEQNRPSNYSDAAHITDNEVSCHKKLL